MSAEDNYAKDLLRRMLQAGNSLALSGDQVTTILRNGQAVSSEQRILRNGSRAYRMEYLQPPSLVGEQIVDNGRLTYHYTPSSNTLEVGPSRVGALRNRVPQVLNQVKHGILVVQWVGQDTVAGHACDIIMVASRDLNEAPWRQFWIDPATGAQLRIDQYDSQKQLVSSSYYTTITYNPSLMPNDFRPPNTAKNPRVIAPDSGGPTLTLPQAQAQAGFPVLQPAYLPQGFHFQAATISDFHQRKLVALRYVNGLNVLSLFETPLPAGARDVIGKIGRPRRGVLVTVQSGVHVVLVGNLGQAEMDRVITSTH